MDPIVEIEHVWRAFRVWKRRPTTLKEFVISSLHRRMDYEEFWGLQDVSFRVPQGEMFGICGSNGSGKSTLLKVIARILPASHGIIRIGGKIVTLLEVATGFHPELTGRENIRLNASLMGLNSAEIARDFDSIVDFADIGSFIDSPVKVYSTGMLMRLGFSVMTHVHGDILVIDEILAVGDLEYQQKCMQWLRDLRQRGTTIIVVSHDLNMLSKLCTQLLWLHRGRVVQQGDPEQVVAKYKEFMIHGELA